MRMNLEADAVPKEEVKEPKQVDPEVGPKIARNLYGGLTGKSRITQSVRERATCSISSP
jgi:hypothetical protein